MVHAFLKVDCTEMCVGRTLRTQRLHRCVP